MAACVLTLSISFSCVHCWLLLCCPLRSVYVIDDQERPVGVVTCTDVVRLIISIVQPSYVCAACRCCAALRRVYVIDDQERPVGVVTCTDVVRLIISIVQPNALPASRPGSAKQLQLLEQQEAEQQQHDQQQPEVMQQ
jgi:CBS-domain-containing membrane protein